MAAAVTAPFRDVIRSGIAFASPQLVLVVAFVAVYGAGLATAALHRRSAEVILAVALGFAGLLAGTVIGFRPRNRSDTEGGPALPEGHRRVVAFGAALIAVGLAALVGYFLRIGGLPILMPSAEAARVEAAAIGGAPLRVLALSAIPGAWLVLAVGSRVGGWLRAGAWLAVLVTAAGWLLTGNRAPGFICVEVAIVLALVIRSRRIGRGAFAGLLALAVTAVVFAGVIGAARLGSAPYFGPPLPGMTVMVGPPPDYATLTRVAIVGYLRVPIQNLVSTVDAVPTRIGWRLGSTYLQPLATVLPGHQSTFDQDLKEALGQTYVGGGTVPGLLGESYANFGPPGWLLVPALLAIALAWLYRLAQALNSPTAWALYAFAIVHVANGMIGGLIVASPFPYVAYGFIAMGLLLEHRGSSLQAAVRRRISRV